MARDVSVREAKSLNDPTRMVGIRTSISYSQHKQLKRLVGYGNMSRLFSVLVVDLLRFLKADPSRGLARIFSGRVSIEELSMDPDERQKLVDEVKQQLLEQMEQEKADAEIY